jgi:hypothetical protein
VEAAEQRTRYFRRTDKVVKGKFKEVEAEL